MLQCLSLLLTLAVMVLALRLMTGPIDLDEFGKKVGRVLMLGVAILVATCLGHFLFTNVLLPDLHGMSQFIARLAIAAFLILLILAAIAFVTDSIRRRGMNRDSNSNKRGEP